MNFVQDNKNFYINNEKVSKKIYFNKLEENGISKKNYESLFDQKRLEGKIKRIKIDFNYLPKLIDQRNNGLENKTNTFNFEIKGNSLEYFFNNPDNLNKIFEGINNKLKK